ncbi:MAG TPA: prenyltransferase [Kofleriaceae bacterium]|nr:prenyltransferase [Kofleriaceae bacterium]
MLTKLVALIRLGRPLFLGGGFLLFALGAAFARLAGHPIDAARYALGQGAVTAFQLMTHYANDYFDYVADRANATPTQWSGGSRVLANDELPRGVALIAALVLAAVGCTLTALLYLRTEDPRVLATALAMAALAWAYSAPPLRLCATGLGELDTAIVVTVLVPWLGFLLQAPDLTGVRLLVLAIVPLALLQFAMLVAIEFPDAASDAVTNKRTLVVRLGAPAAAKLWIAVTVLAFAWLPLAYVLGLPGRIALVGALPAPFALYRIARAGDHRDPAAFERLTLGAVALLVATSACELAATLLTSS